VGINVRAQGQGREQSTGAVGARVRVRCGALEVGDDDRGPPVSDRRRGEASTGRRWAVSTG
jgi:hypothetical protein